LYALPLSTIEGFVLSRVDGAASVEDISMMAGIDQQKLLSILERLRQLGAVELRWMGEGGKVAAVAPAKPVREREADAHFEGGEALYSSAALDEKNVNIAPDARRRILNAFHAMENRDLYALLGVEREADKKQIRDAYFELSKLFHPDAYFGKELGGFKAKMEAVFKRLTEAYDVLGKAKKRAEYDQYLASTELTRRAARTLDSLKLSATDARALADLSRGSSPGTRRSAVEETAGPSASGREAIRQPRGTPSSPRAPEAPFGGTAPAPRGGASSPAAALRGGASSPGATVNASMKPSANANASSQANADANTSSNPAPDTERNSGRAPVVSTAERRARVRDRLRRGLKSISSQMPPAPTSDQAPPLVIPPAAPVPAPEDRRRGVLDGLRSTIQASSVLSGAPSAQLQSHMKKAKDAEGGGDVLMAASQLQLALAIDPHHPELLTEYDRVSKLVARSLADNYEKQAIYEEKTANWQAAARSWARVSDGRADDPKAARRTADALLKAGGDLHLAQKHAQRAVALDTRSVENLTILARVYLAAGLKLNALRELQKAAQLAPNDELVNNLLREAH
jgi:curved DNA-binding protein CbpA